MLDPFCGCGTTIHAAHNLKRNWVGIDISYYIIEVIRRERMKIFWKLIWKACPLTLHPPNIFPLRSL